MTDTKEKTKPVDPALFTRSIFRVSVPNISSTWAYIQPWFASIFADKPTHTPDDVWQMLLAERAQLWIQFCQETGAIEAAFVTEFAAYPRGVWVRIWLGAAPPKVKIHYNMVKAAMNEWARMHGARGFEIIGRHGWLHKFPEAVVEGLCMRVTFDG